MSASEPTLALTKIEAAKQLRISPRWLEELTRKGMVPALPLGFGERKRYLYSRKVLEEWLAAGALEQAGKVSQ